MYSFDDAKAAFTDIPPNILKCLETGPSIMMDGLPVPAILFHG